jgi:Family of unknown function (DUF6074)
LKISNFGDGTIATVIPFPRTRNRAFVRKHAARMLDLRPDTAEKHLAYQLRVQRETMIRRGIDRDVVKQHVRDLELAIRCEAARLICEPTGAA